MTKTNVIFQYILATAVNELQQLYKVWIQRPMGSIFRWKKKIGEENWNKAKDYILNLRPPQASLLSQDLQRATKSKQRNL